MKKNSLMVGFLAILFLLPVLNETTEASFWDKIFGDRKQTTQLPPEPEPPVKSAGQKKPELEPPIAPEKQKPPESEPFRTPKQQKPHQY